jgi:hypothetical protein
MGRLYAKRKVILLQVRKEFNPICPSFVTYNKKGPNGKPLSP